MNRINLSTIFVVFLILIVATTTTVGQSSIEGNWVGGTNALGGWMFAQISFHNNGKGLTGTMDVPGAEASGLSLVDPSFLAPAVKFKIPTPFGLFGFEGELDGDSVAGDIVGPGGAKSKLHLVRSAQLDPRVFESLAGTYDFPTGLSLMVIPTSKGQLTALGIERGVEYTTVTRHILIPAARQKFFSAASVTSSAAADETFSFEDATNGKGNITWRKRDGSVVSGMRKDHFRAEQVRFQNGATVLTGTLLSPLSKGRHPAVMVVPSSGPDTRSNLGKLLRAEMLVRAGFAALIYDKRGSGDSTGDWQSASFDELAGDALAGMAFLQKRKDINARHVGLMGHSQSAWIVPMVASRSAAVSFAVITSGGGSLVADQEAYRVEAQMRNAKFPDAEIAEAINLMKMKWRYGQTGQDWEAYEILAKKAQAKRWNSIVRAPLARDAQYWKFERQLNGFEPAAFIRKLKIPVLVLFGEEDDQVAAKNDAVVWERVLKESGHTDFKITTFPKLGHALLFYQQSGKTILAPDPESVITSWVRARFGTRNK